MMKRVFLSFTEWFIRNKRIIGIIFIALAVIRFLQLNYLNWDHGHLCMGVGGIQYGYDSQRYIDGAISLLHNFSLDFEEWVLYPGYIAFLALIFKLGLGLEVVVVIQMLFALLAAYATYDLCRLITSSRSAGIFAAGMVLINPFIVQWQLFIHTDSLYSSMLIIACWLITKSYFKRSAKYYIPAILAVIFTLAIRPNGWLILPSAVTFILFFFKIRRWYKVAIVAGSLLSFLIFFSSGFMNNLLTYYKIPSLNKRGVIISERPYDCIDPYFSENANGNKSSGIKYYAQETYQYTKLVTKRILAEMFPVYRPAYYFLKFRIYFMIWTLPFYLLSILGIIFYNKNKGFIFSSIIILFHLLFVGLTYADIGFRFLVHILPVFILLGTCGLFSSYIKLHQYSGHAKTGFQIKN